MKQLGISIIGTDTDVGKTFVTGLLGAMAVDDGFAVGMVKPVSSSAVPASKAATHLMRAAGIPEARRHEVNPYAIAGDFSPRLAAELSGIEINYDGVVAHTLDVVNRYDLTFVEGAGGITTPLYGDTTFTDLMKDIKLPAIVVADGRLGSINRAILTCEYAKIHGIEVKAIIVNDTTAVDPFLLKTNVEDMERYTGIPVVAVVPPYQGPDIQKVRLNLARFFIDSKKVWNTVLGI